MSKDLSIKTMKQALIFGLNELKTKNISSARLDAEILLGFVSKLSREELLLKPKLQISNSKFQVYKKLISKRAKHTPIAYLTGSREFYGINFRVNASVLIPRPETEMLVESIIGFLDSKSLKNHKYPNILEIGTGSGCIALTLAKYLPNAKITAVDISEKALRVARKNYSSLKPQIINQKRLRFIQSNFLSNIKVKPDILVANLPYLTKEELKEPSISKEPKLALYGGKDGLEAYRVLFKQLKDRGWENMAIFIEIGSNQARKVGNMVWSLLPEAKIETKMDLSNRDRVVIIKI